LTDIRLTTPVLLAVTIGPDTLLGPDVKIYTVYHSVDPDQRAQDDASGHEYRLPVTIGSNCWIGGGATILPGITIGDGSTVAAGTVVTEDVESRCLVAGVPAKVTKRFPIVG
jgi:maltose O-acetyltransferase